jgi:polar amino acid transport system substrate-binding protein
MTKLNLNNLLKYFLYPCALLLLFIPNLGGLWAEPKNTVHLTTHNLCPYGCYEDDSPNQQFQDSNFTGRAVDVVRCVFQKMDVSLELKVLPWERAQRMVMHEKADGGFSASQQDYRDEFAVMSDIIAEQKWQWYLLKENPLDPSQESFKQQATVGGFIGAHMLKWMEEEGYNIRARPINTEGLLKVLLSKRVDAVMANNLVMEELLKKYEATNRVKSFINKDKPLGVYFSKNFVSKHPTFLESFNRNIPACIALEKATRQYHQ